MPKSPPVTQSLEAVPRSHWHVLTTLPPSLALRRFRHENTEDAAARLRDSWLTVWWRLPQHPRTCIDDVHRDRKLKEQIPGSVFVLESLANFDDHKNTFAFYNGRSASYFFLASFIHTLPDSLLEALIAHEHAHAVLWAMGDGKWHEKENECDRLVTAWGFPMAELRQRT